MFVELTHKGENYMRDRIDNGDFADIGFDIDILIYLFQDHLDERVDDEKIGMDLKILREDLDKSLYRLENKKYIRKNNNKRDHNLIYNVRVINKK